MNLINFILILVKHLTKFAFSCISSIYNFLILSLSLAFSSLKLYFNKVILSIKLFNKKLVTRIGKFVINVLSYWINRFNLVIIRFTSWMNAITDFLTKLNNYDFTNELAKRSVGRPRKLFYVYKVAFGRKYLFRVYPGVQQALIDLKINSDVIKSSIANNTPYHGMYFSYTKLTKSELLI